MEIFGQIVMLLAGCGVFMLGFKLLSEHMEKLAGNGLKSFFNKISNNKFLGLLIGMITTIVIQSSSVTTVMVVGFVNSGIMSLIQATSVIIGANIGTTITSYLAGLSAAGGIASIINYLCLACLFVGVFIEMFAKTDNKKSLGLVLTGLGAVFLGLETMSGSMSFMRDVPEINAFIATLDNPFLLLFIGMAFTAIVQSSSAVTSIIVLIAASNPNAFGGTGNAVYFLILGSNIGTCVTAMISSVGASTNARRASLIHLMFNTFGAVIFAVLLLVWKNFSSTLIESWITSKEWQVCAFHTIFNCTCALIFLPLSKYLVKVSTMIIKDKNEEVKDSSELVYMDKRLVLASNISVSMLKKDVFRMGDMAMTCLHTAFDAFVKRDISMIKEIEYQSEQISKLGKNITDALVFVSSHQSSLEIEKQINDLHTNVGDIVRIAELSENFAKYTKKEVNQELYFSDEVIENLQEMCNLLDTQFDSVKSLILDENYEITTDKIEELEEQVDNMRRSLIADHIERLKQGKCKPENNTVFINLVSNLERIGDHIYYIVR